MVVRRPMPRPAYADDHAATPSSIHALFVRVSDPDSTRAFGGWRFEGLATTPAELHAFTVAVKADMARPTAPNTTQTTAYKVVDLTAPSATPADVPCPLDGECCAHNNA